MENSVDFEEWQLSKLDHFLAVTNIHDTEVALSLLKSLNWDMEKAIEEHLLDNTESLSMSSSGSDFIVIDSSLSNNEHIERSMDEPTIIYNTNWNTAIASLPDDNTSESDDSYEVISISEGTSAVSYANVKANIDDSEQCDLKISFILGSSPIVTDYVKQKNDEH